MKLIKVYYKTAWITPTFVACLFVLFLAMTTLVFGGVGKGVLPLVVLGAGGLGLLALPTATAVTPAQQRFIAFGSIVLWLMLAGLSLYIIPYIGLHPFALSLSDLGLSPMWPSLSISPGVALENFMLALGYAATACVLVWVARDEQAAQYLRQGVAGIAIVFAIYGLVTYASGNAWVLWIPKEHYPEALTATFINRNMAASFLGLGVLACLGCALARIGEISRQLDFAQRLKAFGLLVLRPGQGWFLGAALCAVALVLTTSRAGILAVGVGVGVMFFALIWARPAVRVPLLAGGLLCVFVFALIANLVGAGLITRLEKTGNTQELRPVLNTLSAEIFTNYGPWLGQGPGGWAAALAVHRTDEITVKTGALEYAHNTYWQGLVELGAPGMVMLALGVLAAVYVMVQGLRQRRRQVVWPALGLGAMAQMALHSWPDMPFIMPAITLAWLALVIPACVQALPQRVNLGVPEPMQALQPTPALVRVSFAAIALLACLFSIWWGAAQWPATQAAAVVAQLNNGATVTPDNLHAARKQLSTCMQRNPLHPTCGADLTLVLMNQASEQGVRSANGQTLLGLARRAARKALAANPAQPVLAYRLAQIENLTNGAKVAAPYLIHSVLAGPTEPRLAQVRALFLLEMLPYLQGDDLARAESNLRLVWRLGPRQLWGTVLGQEFYIQRLKQVLMAGAVLPAEQEALAKYWQHITRQPW